MRTTVDLPDELVRSVKAKAAIRGETVKQFLERAVVHELGAVSPRRSGRVVLPLVGSARPGTVDISNRDIEAVFADEDAEKTQRR